MRVGTGCMDYKVRVPVRRAPVFATIGRGEDVPGPSGRPSDVRRAGCRRFPRIPDFPEDAEQGSFQFCIVLY